MGAAQRRALGARVTRRIVMTTLHHKHLKFLCHVTMGKKMCMIMKKLYEAC